MSTTKKIKITKKKKNINKNLIVQNYNNKELAYENIKKNIVLSKDNRVEPLFWMLPNKKAFPQWVYNTFKQYRMDGTYIEKPSKYTPFKYQEFLRDYMQENSPYRGLLLYHGLGSGKTCTAIEIAENLKNHKDIIIMLPASLKGNFITQGILYCGDPEYKVNEKLWKNKYNFVSYNANNTPDQLKSLGSLDNKVIIIEEAHNLVSKLKSGLEGRSKHGLEIYNMLMNCYNTKIIALSGTPLINEIFELGVLFNILRGNIEITIFRILSVDEKYGNTWDLKDLESKLLNLDYIDYVEINKINKSIEFHITINHKNEKYESVLDNINNICSENGVYVKKLNRMDYTLFPTEDDGEVFYKYFIENTREGEKFINSDLFKNRLLGLVSYYKANEKDYPTEIENEIVRVVMSQDQLDIYNRIRELEKKTEKGSTKSKKKKNSTKVQSLFRVYSRQACNFVFPDEIIRPYRNPKFVINVKKKNKNNNSGISDNEFKKMLNSDYDDNFNNKQKISKEYKLRIDKALQKLEEKADIYLKPDKNGLDKYSPKMKIMLENINRSKGPVFVYSDFRNLEGVEIFSMVLKANNYSHYTENNNKFKYAIYSGLEKEEERNNIVKLFNSSENIHGEKIKVILSTRAGVEGLDLKYIRQVHIMEPYWNELRIKQAIGRAVRRGSHKDLPLNERTVEVFKYVSVLDNNLEIKNGDKLSTDEYILKISRNKQKIINDVLLCLKESSIDCLLNELEIKEKYDCITFGKDPKGFSYLPKISKDLVYSYSPKETRVIKKDVILAGVYKNKIYIPDKNSKKWYLVTDTNKKNLISINQKEIIPVYVNLDKNEIFDYKSAKKDKTIKIGVIEKNGNMTKV